MRNITVFNTYWNSRKSNLTTKILLLIDNRIFFIKLTKGNAVKTRLTGLTPDPLDM